MFKRPARWMTPAALALAALTACSDGPGLTEVSVPFSEDLTADPIDASPSAGLTLEMASRWVQETGATLVTTESEDFGDVATAIIGRKGGTLHAGDHTLVIPPRAVVDDTWFRMEVVAGANILVDLSAFEFDDGRIRYNEPINDFRRVPLTLILSYEGVLLSGDAEQLRNVYLYLDSPSHMIPLVSTVDEETKTLSSPIEHFSLYGMAIE